MSEPEEKQEETIEEGEMTIREAGKSGEERKEELGPEGYAELGKDGGTRVQELIEEDEGGPSGDTSGGE